jgi:hypothetical protein
VPFTLPPLLVPKPPPADPGPLTNTPAFPGPLAPAATNAPAAVALSASSTAFPLAPADPIMPFPVPDWAQPVAPPPPEGAGVDPQALLARLLTASTNDPGPRIIMPVFVPPPPPAPFPSSHATYESR